MSLLSILPIFELWLWIPRRSKRLLMIWLSLGMVKRIIRKWGRLRNVGIFCTVRRELGSPPWSPPWRISWSMMFMIWSWSPLRIIQSRRNYWLRFRINLLLWLRILIALLISPGNGGRRKERKRRKTLLRRVKKKRLQNVVDGIRSACGGERLIIFTTNHKEKVDEALIRRGRMDKHIEMPYCGFEAFKAVAMNYLDVEWDE